MQAAYFAPVLFLSKFDLTTISHVSKERHLIYLASFRFTVIPLPYLLRSIAENGLEDPRKRLRQLVRQVVVRVDRNIVLQIMYN